MPYQPYQPYQIIEVKEYECTRCGYKWIARKNGVDKPAPKCCPKCKTTCWSNRVSHDIPLLLDSKKKNPEPYTLEYIERQRRIRTRNSAIPNNPDYTIPRRY